MKSTALAPSHRHHPHSTKLVAHAFGFGFLVGVAVLVGQVLWARLMPQERPIDLASLPTCLAAVAAAVLAYCEARWPERTLAFLGRAASPVLIGLVVFLAAVARA